jgi:hypothetical protein
MEDMGMTSTMTAAEAVRAKVEGALAYGLIVQCSQDGGRSWVGVTERDSRDAGIFRISDDGGFTFANVRVEDAKAQAGGF